MPASSATFTTSGMGARVRIDDGPDCFDIGQGLRQICKLAPMLFNLFFAAMIMVASDESREDEEMMAYTVEVKRMATRER